MAGNQIKIDQMELQRALWVLKQLENGTGLQGRTPDWFLLSISETADGAEELYRTLQNAEGYLLTIVRNTIRALEAAGVSFAEADAAAAQGFRDVPGFALE